MYELSLVSFCGEDAKSDYYEYSLSVRLMSRSKGLSLQDMLFLGAWRMGLGFSGKVLPPSSSPGLFKIWLVHNFGVS